MRHMRAAVALLTLTGSLGALPSAPAGGRPLMLVLSYDGNAVVEVHADGSLGNAILTADDGLDGPFGANALLRHGESCLYIGNFDGRRVLRSCTSGPAAVVADASDGVNTPDGLAAGSDGELYIANRFARNILRVDPNGVVSVVDLLDGRPMSIASAAGSLFVADDRGNIFRYELDEPAGRVLIASLSDNQPVGNVAMAVSSDGNTVFHLDAGVLREIPAQGGPAVVLTGGMGGADEGLAMIERADGRLPPVFFASDFAGVIYRFDPGDSVRVFSTAVAGPSGMLTSPCGGLLTCDSNCDGQIDVLDINPFVAAILDPLQYREQFPACDWLCNNDINVDGAVNVLDISLFVACVVGW